MTAAPPSLEPCEELARLLALAFWKTHYKGDDEPMAHRLAAKQWNGQPFMAEAKAIITAGWRRAPSAEGRLREALANGAHQIRLALKDAAPSPQAYDLLMLANSLEICAALRGEP